tara:strand:+ start:17203 stop:18189 length:987 start_codon:yes stop_codon:yes gene_type:complete
MEIKGTEMIRSEIDVSEEDHYYLGTGDILYINFLSLKEYSKQYEILNDGKIYLPFNKTIYLKGFTIQKATRAIESALSSELIDPSVEISIFNRRPIRVTLSGEVMFNGVYTLKKGDEIEGFGNKKIIISTYPTIIDAIQIAGGLKSTSETKNIILRREIPNSNKFKETTINLNKLILEGDQNNNPFLFDGDIIHIPRTNFNEILARKSNLVQNKLKIYIVGEVKNPGEYFIPQKANIDQAILIAGGPIRNRGKSSILISRTDEFGENLIKRIRYDYKSKSKSKLALKNGDILYLETNLFGRGSDFINDVSKPADGILRTFTLIKLLND